MSGKGIVSSMVTSGSPVFALKKEVSMPLYKDCHACSKKLCVRLKFEHLSKEVKVFPLKPDFWASSFRPA